MAVFNTDYYKNEDLYSDGDIENVLLDLVSGKVAMSDLENIEYPIIYHLSKVRENILNWYPFDKNATLLEIGSGCGAITGMLCSKVKRVVSAELSKRRATINYQRNKDIDNLEIFVGNLNEMSFDCKFDYVVLNGVFEYAISFTDSANPYELFLDNIKKFLKKGGKVIIAIENKYGLKYFAGAPEDHTNQFFLGLNDYQDNTSVRTFGKNEMTDLLKRVGFEHTKYYYPYPDYKFPNEIFTDETIVDYGYGRDYHNLNSDRFLLFNEEKVARGLAREGVISTFANSFLVVASDEAVSEEKEILYAKINNDRNDQFRISTQIYMVDGKRYVSKIPLSPAASGHIDSMIHKVTCNNGNLKCVETLHRDKLIYNYIECETLDGKLRDLINNADVDGVINCLEQFFDKAFEGADKCQFNTQEFKDVFGSNCYDGLEDCISDANIDLICDNVFLVDSEYCVIDSEWVFEFPVPVRFIMWRTINELYTKYSKLRDVILPEELYSRFDISVERMDYYSDWNYCFSKVYVGADSLAGYSIPKEHIYLEDLMDNNLTINRANSYLYYDNGTGFSEDNKLTSVIRIVDSKFSISFDLRGKGNIKSVRWDPLENRRIRVKITNIKTNCHVELSANNEDMTNDGFYNFFTCDPRFIISSTCETIENIAIQGELHYITVDEGEIVLQQFKNTINEKDSCISILENKLCSSQIDNDILQKYVDTLSTESISTGEQINSIRNENESLLKQIIKLEKENREYKKMLDNREQTIRLLQQL